MVLLGTCDVRLGCQGFSAPDWDGVFYPPHVAPAARLAYYASTFDFLEVDSTFYAIPSARSVVRWRQDTPPGFRFAAKVPQAITHDPDPTTGLPRMPLQGEGWQRQIELFVDRMRLLGDKLVALVVQLPPQWHCKPERLAALSAFLAVLPGDVGWAVEFRHRGWLNDDVLSLLKERGVAFVMQDLYYMPVRVEVTSCDLAYIRLQGRRSEITRMNAVQIERADALDFWTRTVQALAASGVRTVALAANNHYQGFAPGTITSLQQRLGLPVSPPPARTEPLV